MAPFWHHLEFESRTLREFGATNRLGRVFAQDGTDGGVLGDCLEQFIGFDMP